MATEKPKPPEEDEVPGVPEWVVTYGDMMSLLLTFFIMLVSMSELKSSGTLRAAMDAIREAFGPSAGSNSAPGKSLQTTSANTGLGSTGSRSDGGTKKTSRNTKGPAGAHGLAQRISHGTTVTMGGPAHFKPFDATLSDELKQNLDIIAEVVGPKPNRLMVRGHTSPEPLPPESPFRDKFDLSYARARAVSEYLVTKGVDRRRLVVSAAGDSEPRMRTRRKGRQWLNRRVDVFLIDSYISSPRP